MVKKKVRFVCSECGAISQRYLGRCNQCGEWGTFVEERIEENNTNRKTRISLDGQRAKVQKISDVTSEEVERIKLEIEEFNRTLGGGVVPGSLVLIGGNPGIGKSTLLLQMSSQLAALDKTVLYVTGEESSQQVKLRADRLSLGQTEFYIYPETDMAAIKEQIDQLNPDFVIIDSVQTMQEPDMTSPIGSVAQIREVTADLLQIAKTNGITIFIVGHVTKDGAIAGPKILEHMVDTVLYFEGDQHHSYRILRTVKNRFGATNELGVFEMKNIGLVEVKNPSAMFLEERSKSATGSAVVASMEGSRPILVEIQALIVPSVFASAQRTATGLEKNRLSLIMAVIEKRVKMLVQNQDAYVKVAGGVKLNEPAIDLAIAIAIMSSYKGLETKMTDCFIGELGLTGEVRAVSQIETRINEAKKMGFKRVIIPKHNMAELQPIEGLQIVGVTRLDQAFQIAFD